MAASCAERFVVRCYILYRHIMAQIVPTVKILLGLPAVSGGVANSFESHGPQSYTGRRFSYDYSLVLRGTPSYAQNVCQ